MRLFAYRNRIDDEDLYWSNDDGWVDIPSATLFSLGETKSLPKPIGAVAIDEVVLDGRRRSVKCEHLAFDPCANKQANLLLLMRREGVRSHGEQRSLLCSVLEEQAGIACHDADSFSDLLAAVVSNIDDGTLSCHCIMHQLEKCQQDTPQK